VKKIGLGGGLSKMAYKIKSKWLAPLNKGFSGWNTEVYKGYTLRFEKLKSNRKYFGVLAYKGGEEVTDQYIGVGKTKREAMADAKSSVDLWRDK